MSSPDGRHGEGDMTNAHRCMVQNSSTTLGGHRSELFPMSSLPWRDRRARSSPFLADAAGVQGYGRRMAGRVNEAIGSLNALSNVSVRSIKRGSFDHGLRPGDKPTRPQEAILSRLATNVHESGTCPAGLTPKLCFEEVIKSKDMYSLSQCAVAPYDLALLKVAKTETVPKEATQLLPPTEASYLLHPERHILRSPQDIQTWADANADFHPYWDETLRKDRQLRLELYQILAKKSLLSFRKKISARVGLFFVWKASRKGIRLIVDARMANACHVRPPKTRLGGASALAELDAFLQDSDLAALGEGYGGPVSLPCNLFGCTGDVSDAFYQFSVETLAEWFGLDDPVFAFEFGVTEVWDPDKGCNVKVQPGERLFPVFVGMPQGWAWALHFCNCAVEYNMSKALGASQFVKEGLPPPDLRQGPVGSVYVDNIGTFGFLGSAVTKSFDDCVQTLESAGFVLHELDKDSVEVANVGIVVHRYKKEIRHTRKRSWRLYLALKHVLRLKKITCEALRIVIGHLVHYFTLFRPALSVLHHSYKFVYEHLDGRSHSLPGRVKRELRMAVGLIFQIKVDLSAPYADHIYCGDSSTYGYCFQSTPSTAEEQRHLFRYHERWRFVQLEEGVGQGLGSHHAWSADFALPDIAYARWLCARNAIPFPGGEELEKGSKDFSGGDHLRRFHHVDLVGLVPRLPDSLVDHTRWRTIIQRKWKHNESIHMKEGRVALMTLRREAKKASSHGKRLLTLCDNLSATCAFDKGRAKDLALLVLCRKAAAIQIGTAIRWHLRYVESARNPSDRDSRVFPGDHGHRGSPLSAADATGLKQGFSNHTPPLLSSSCTARGGNPTAVSSRGGVRGGSPVGQAVGVERCVPRRAKRTEGCSLEPANSEARPPLLCDDLLTPSSPSRSIVQTSHVVKRSAKLCSSVPEVAPSFIELFSGSSRLTAAVQESGLRVGVPFDLSNGNCFDLTKVGIQHLILDWIKTHRIWYVHLATPSTVYRIAKKKSATGTRLKMSDQCAHFTASVILQCELSGVFYSLENPKSSKLLRHYRVQQALASTSAVFIEYDCCRYGCSYRKPTYIATNCRALVSLGLRCLCGGKHNDQLRGRVKLPPSSRKPGWHWKTSLAGEYPGPLCFAWASLLQYVAPASAHRSAREPLFLPGWLDEVSKVTSSTVPSTFILEQCPKDYTCPWASAADSWGTERQEAGSGSKRSSQQAH